MKSKRIIFSACLCFFAFFLTFMLSGCDKDDGCSHTYSEWSIIKSPDCDDSGTKSKTCSKCGDVVTVTIPALGHNYVNDKCTECGDER